MKRFLLPPGMILVSVALVGVMIANAQGTQPPAGSYVGSRACAGCHPAEYKNWANSLHARVIQSPASLPTTTAILADLTQLDKIISDSKARYTAQDILYTIGGHYRQRYILQDSRSKRLVVAAGEWNIGGHGPAESDNTWQAAPAADWLNECAGCHTSGFDPRAAGNYKGGPLPFAEAGVGCEACHGAGSEHAETPTKDNIPLDKIEVLDAAICGQCHTRGVSPNVNGKVYDYPVDYVPGDKLTEENFIPLKPSGVITDNFWWQDGHAKDYRQQYIEWGNSAHASSLEHLQDIEATDACLSCHSTDYIVAVSSLQAGEELVTPTLKTAQFGVTCQACHSPHQENTRPFNALLRDERYRLCASCHNATSGGRQPLAPNTSVHHAVQEMFEGQAVLQVAGQPSPHMPRGSQGAECTTCHMPRTAGNADPGDTATHNWTIIRPGQGPDACSACHANPKSNTTQFSDDTLSLMIDLRQNETQGQLRTLNKLLREAKSAHPEWNPQATNKTEQQLAYERAVTYISFVETDGSSGIHNYAYARAVLAKADTELVQQAKATATPTATSTPSPTPTLPPPTPIPTPTPVPPPSGGASWSIWALLAGVIGLVVLLLVIRRPER